MKIIITCTEIQEAEDDPFEAKSEEIILKSTIPFTRFREQYQFKLLFPESLKGSWQKEFRHVSKLKPYRLLKEVGGFLESATSRIKK